MEHRLTHTVSDDKKFKSFFKYSCTYTSKQKESNLMACTSNTHTIIITYVTSNIYPQNQRHMKHAACVWDAMR